MAKRHEMIGIKQVIRLEWMERTASMLLAGLKPAEIRKELHGYLEERTGSSTEERRGDVSRGQAVNILMRTWVTPEADLVAYRDAAAAAMQEHPDWASALHWGLISAAYPFWFNTAQQVGRLLRLQDQVTHGQIVNRLKEQYGDRQTVSRYARYVIRSFTAWGFLEDTEISGSYRKGIEVEVQGVKLAVLLLEAALLADPQGRGALQMLLKNPGMYPFSLPVLGGSMAAQVNPRLEVIRFGLDEEYLKVG